MKACLFLMLFLCSAVFAEEKLLPIHLAAVKGDKEAVINILLKDKTMLNKSNENGYQPIHFAILHNRTELVKYFIELGVPVEAKVSGTNTSTLMFAVGEGNKELVEFFLAKGADINYVSGESSPNFKYKTGTTALQIAAYHGNLKMIKLLLDKGAKVNIIGGGFYPKTALDDATKAEVKQLLIEHGAKTAKELIGGK